MDVLYFNLYKFLFVTFYMHCPLPMHFIFITITIEHQWLKGANAPRGYLVEINVMCVCVCTRQPPITPPMTCVRCLPFRKLERKRCYGGIRLHHILIVNRPISLFNGGFGGREALILDQRTLLYWQEGRGIGTKRVDFHRYFLIDSFYLTATFCRLWERSIKDWNWKSAASNMMAWLMYVSVKKSSLSLDSWANKAFTLHNIKLPLWRGFNKALSVKKLLLKKINIELFSKTHMILNYRSIFFCVCIFFFYHTPML